GFSGSPQRLLVVPRPLLHMFLPSSLGQKSADPPSRRYRWKSTAALMIVIIVGVIGIRWSSNWLCGGRWGVTLCQPALMYVLLTAIVPLSLLRVLVLLQFARGRDWFPLWLSIPAAVY